MSNFELVMKGEGGRELKEETGFPLPQEVLDIKEEQLGDVDELPHTSLENPLMSPCPFDTDQVFGVEPEPDMLLVDLPTTDLSCKTESVIYNVTDNLENPLQQGDNWRIVLLQNVTPQQPAYRVLNGEENQQSEENNLPVVSVQNLLSIKSIAPQTNLIKANFLSSQTPVCASRKQAKRKQNSNSNRKVSKSKPVLKDEPKKKQQKSVLQKTNSNNVHKNSNSNNVSSKRKNVKSNPVDYHCVKCNTSYENALLLLHHSCANPNSKFHCEKCPKIFISSKTLQKHIEKKHSNTVDKNLEVAPVICLRRVEEWYSGKIYSPKPNLTCAVCKYVTTSKKSLKLHIKAHFKIKYFKCKFCDTKFLIKFHLKMHYKNFHKIQNSKYIFGKTMTSKKNPENKFSCKKCNMKLKTNLALHIHLKSHSDSSKTKPNFDHGKITKKNYTCKICNKKISSSSKISDHIFKDHDRQKIVQFCSQNTSSDSDDGASLASTDSDSKCTTRSELLKQINLYKINNEIELHIHDQNVSNAPKYQPINQFETTENHSSHEYEEEIEDTINLTDSIVLDKIETPELPFPCNQMYSCHICEIYFLSTNSLYKHSQDIHSSIFVHTSVKRGKNNGQFKCLECHNSFTKSWKLRQHNIVHRGIKAFPCMFCTNIYTNLNTAYHHFSTAHNPLWKLKNRLTNKENCDYMFEGSDYISIRKIDSETHMVFNCHKCDIIFKTKSEIYKHCKEIHSDVKDKNRFFCNICNADFTTNDQLVSHKTRLHRRGSCYCDKCGKEFDTLESLKKHITSSTCKGGTKSHVVKETRVLSLRKREKNSRKLKNRRINLIDDTSKLIVKESDNIIQERFRNRDLNDDSQQTQNMKEAGENEEIDENLSDSEDSKNDNFNYSSESESNSEDGKGVYQILTQRFLNANEKNFGCNLCNEKFYTLKELLKHADKFHEITVIDIPIAKPLLNNGTYKCDLCLNRYSDNAGLRSHMLKHKNIKPYFCKNCKKTFSNKGPLLFHYKKYHQNIYIEKFQKRKELMTILKNQKKILSDNCNNNVNSFSRVYTCSICKYYYSDLKYLIKHSQKFHSNNFNIIPIRSLSGPYKCDECEQSFTSAIFKKYHKLKHRNISPFPCLFCTKVYADIPALKNHYKKRHNLKWELHEQKKEELKTLRPLQSEYKTYMFEGSKYITLTDLNRKRLSFECHDCKLVFNKRDDALNHCKNKHSRIQKNKNEDTSQCGDETQSSFGQLENIVIEFCCNLCDHIFDNHLNLQKHQQDVHENNTENVPEGPFSCDDCGQKFVKFDVLEKHITSSACKFEINPQAVEKTEFGIVTHQKRKSVESNERKLKKLKTSNDPEVKIEGHGVDELAGCIQDDLPTDSKINNKHSETVTNGIKPSSSSSSDVKSLVCDDCGTWFDSKLKLKIHMKRHIKYYYNRDEKMIQKHCSITSKTTCKICYRRFKSLTRLKSHLCINQIKKYNCSICKAIFESKHLYVLHKTTHEKTFVCEICGSEFLSESQLKMHKARRHEEHNFLCYLCGCKFPTSGVLNAHLKRHEKNIEYSCKGCDKKFLSVDSMRQHYNTVHSDACFFCRVCNKSFNRRDHRNGHEKRKHYGGEKRQCELCKKIFHSNTGFKNHMVRAHNTT